MKKKKEKEKKNLGTEPGWPLPIEHGAGRWAGHGSRLGARAAGRVGRPKGVGMARKAQRAGRGSRLGCWAARRVVGMRARAGAQARADAQAAGGRRAGARGAQAGRRQRTRHGAGGRAVGRASARLGERACGWAHGARGARSAGSTGAQPVRTGWASWVLVHPAWCSAWFFDSVFFLSH